jgi:hypothetical protein
MWGIVRRATKNQVLHWTASGRWRRVTVPEPGGTAPGDNNNLNAVRCASATDCWAVGDVQHLDQRGWTRCCTGTARNGP